MNKTTTKIVINDFSLLKNKIGGFSLLIIASREKQIEKFFIEKKSPFECLKEAELQITLQFDEYFTFVQDDGIITVSLN